MCWWGSLSRFCRAWVHRRCGRRLRGTSNFVRSISITIGTGKVGDKKRQKFKKWQNGAYFLSFSTVQRCFFAYFDKNRQKLDLKQLYFVSGYNRGPVYHLRVVEQKSENNFFGWVNFLGWSVNSHRIHEVAHSGVDASCHGIRFVSPAKTLLTHIYRMFAVVIVINLCLHSSHKSICVASNLNLHSEQSMPLSRTKHIRYPCWSTNGRWITSLWCQQLIILFLHTQGQKIEIEKDAYILDPKKIKPGNKI